MSQSESIRMVETLTGVDVRESVDLAEVSRWRIGGVAHALIEPRSAAQTAQVLRALESVDVPYVIIGETSNLLFDSEGYDGVLVRVGRQMSAVEVSGTSVVAEAGVSVPELAMALGQQGLTGIEHTVGIPGTLGGLVAMNGGTMRRGIGENVRRVRIARPDGTLTWMAQSECAFSYRSSIFQGGIGAIVQVELNLSQGSPDKILKAMAEITESRAARFPEEQPNCGSTFISDPALYAKLGAPGAVIESAGFKGAVLGGAQVSPQHANFINNVGAATSADVLGLIAAIRAKVHGSTGHWLECEVRYVARDGAVMPAHRAADVVIDQSAGSRVPRS